MRERILVVEDDSRLGTQIVEHLRGAGFEATWWMEGRSLMPGALPDVRLVVLDLMLPGTYGLDMLKALRGFSEVPVLILSARNDTLDKVRALKLGADDYLTKPFWPEELIERVRARLRRPALCKEGAVLELGPLRVDLHGRAVQVEGRVVELTRVEFEVLAALARRPSEAVTRQWLAEHVLDPTREGTERTLDVHVSRLRRKLAPTQCVETVWGVGYRLTPRTRA
ncbi:response regulator transcription factor [Myxococcus landrumensis]|uniref:Response regulator transcription factor n=1 Tax=Myxococcus landrumensis TaxID=2813577 RepID=A0ABX7N9Q3_9BACT|nr:response regulator transcription factor [Myxococcus landrumus]QSQ15510.1 response regulator transcription factor [Myxococcus landrumus]